MGGLWLYSRPRKEKKQLLDYLAKFKYTLHYILSKLNFLWYCRRIYLFLYLSVEGRIVSVCNYKLSKGWEGGIVCACKDGGGTEKRKKSTVANDECSWREYGYSFNFSVCMNYFKTKSKGEKLKQ